MLKPQSGIARLPSRETLTLSWNLPSHTRLAEGCRKITLRVFAGFARPLSRDMPAPSSTSVVLTTAAKE